MVTIVKKDLYINKSNLKHTGEKTNADKQEIQSIPDNLHIIN